MIELGQMSLVMMTIYNVLLFAPATVLGFKLLWFPEAELGEGAVEKMQPKRRPEKNRSHPEGSSENSDNSTEN